MKKIRKGLDFMGMHEFLRGREEIFVKIIQNAISFLSIILDFLFAYKNKYMITSF